MTFTQKGIVMNVRIERGQWLASEKCTGCGNYGCDLTVKIDGGLSVENVEMYFHDPCFEEFRTVIATFSSDDTVLEVKREKLLETSDG